MTHLFIPPDEDPAEVPEEVVTHNEPEYQGLLKSFSPKDGYGFLDCAELWSVCERDVYVRTHDLPAQAQCGVALKFKVTWNSRGQPQAYQVSFAAGAAGAGGCPGMVDLWQQQPHRQQLQQRQDQQQRRPQHMRKMEPSRVCGSSVPWQLPLPQASASSSATLPTSPQRLGRATASPPTLPQTAAMAPPSPLASASPSTLQQAAGVSPTPASPHAASPHAASPAETAPKKMYQGLLKTFSAKSGYGFILCEETRKLYGRDVYVHQAKLPQSVCCGTELQFTVRNNAKGQPQAHDVSLVDTRQSDSHSAEALLDGLCGFEECNLETSRADSPTIRVASWNILAPAYATCAAFPDADPAALRWSRRSAQIKEVLSRIGADIICFQEVETAVEPEQLGLSLLKFGRLTSQRPGSRSDSCMVFWRLEKFRLLRERLISYEDYLPPPPSSDDPDSCAADQRYRTGDCAVIVELVNASPHAAQHEKLVVATTHLAWGDKNEDVRMWQLTRLLTELAAFQCTYAIVCGDLNCVSTGEVYKTLASHFQSAYDGAEDKLATTSNANSKGGDGFVETIDYCWVYRGGLELCRRLKLPLKETLRTLLGGQPAPAAIPTLVSSGKWPSDHLPVGVDVSWPSGPMQ